MEIGRKSDSPRLQQQALVHQAQHLRVRAKAAATRLSALRAQMLTPQAFCWLTQHR